MSPEQKFQSETDNFIQIAGEYLRPLYITDETRAQFEATGNTIGGFQYFRELFAVGPDITQHQRLASILVGCMALDETPFSDPKHLSLIGEQARELLLHQPNYGEEQEKVLFKFLGDALQAERRSNKYGRVGRLQKEAKIIICAGKTLAKQASQSISIEKIAA